MKYEEAIETLRSTYIELHGGDCTHLNYNHALEMAIEALEIQTPKKPKRITKKQVYDPDRPFSTIDFTTLACPCCGNKIMLRKPFKRCFECGQAIDWSGEECQEE